MTYKFRLYPNEEQERKLLWTLDKCRFVYNQMLAGLNGQEKPNKYELKRHLPLLKKSYPELKGVHSQVLQNEVYRLFWNLKSLSNLRRMERKSADYGSKERGGLRLLLSLNLALKSLKQVKGLIFLICPKLGIYQ